MAEKFHDIPGSRLFVSKVLVHIHALLTRGHRQIEALHDAWSQLQVDAEFVIRSIWLSEGSDLRFGLSSGHSQKALCALTNCGVILFS